jgi:UDP-3-O-acyl N-acetylglucosamine deacetylase
VIVSATGEHGSLACRGTRFSAVYFMDELPRLMSSPRKQQTIADRAHVKGFGYWTGRDVCVEFRPAEEDSGIVFVRADFAGCPRVDVAVANRIELPRRTSLRQRAVEVHMIEHVMAALTGLQIDNCEVWVTEAEMPGCDGSCLPFVEVLEKAGVIGQDATRRQIVVDRPVRLGDDAHWIEARPSPSGQTRLSYELDYGPGNAIGRQTYELDLSVDGFRRELAPARTFMLRAEAEQLRSLGLGRRTTCRDLLVFDSDGPIDNSQRFADECVRHKLMDMVGDFGLAGCDLVAHVVAYRSGHQLNAELIRALTADTETAPWRQSA